ncbi:MAG: hypothetical protein ABIQ74_06535 [Chitinophagales bacterium]
MKRRDFVTTAGFFTFLNLLPLSRLFAKTLLLNDETQIWEELIAYARWSPSPHNVQPWRMKIISGREAHLYYDPSRLLPVVDPTSGFIILGMSMFIESLSIAANPAGYKIVAEHSSEKQLDFASTDLKLFAKLYRIETGVKDPTDRELIRKRKTSRLHYDNRVIGQGLVNSFSSLADSYGYNFTCSFDKELIADVIELNSKAILHGSEDVEARNELSRWIRTSDEEAAAKKDGLWYRCMQVKAKLMENFFYHHERFQSKWKRKLLTHSLTNSVKGTSNIAWISGPFENRADWINAGVMLQRLWLEMTKFNVYLHPFGAIINETYALDDLKNSIQYSVNEGTLWFLIRLGYCDEPPASFRLEVKDILIS